MTEEQEVPPEELLSRTLQQFRMEWTFKQRDVKQLENGTFFYLAEKGDLLLETALSLQNSFEKKGISVQIQRASGLYMIQWNEKVLFSN